MNDDDWKGEHLIRGAHRYSHAGHQGTRYVIERTETKQENQTDLGLDRPHKPWSVK